MATRRDARQWAVQLLFQRDFNQGALDEALADFWIEKNVPDEARSFMEELVRGVTQHGPAIDNKMQSYAENWDLNRMAAVDRNVMRVALYEMLYRDDIPPVVSINEAVDLAKQYSGPESGKFVNGILDRASKDIQRPARTTIRQGSRNEE